LQNSCHRKQCSY